jgi:hypothetical protein
MRSRKLKRYLLAGIVITMGFCTSDTAQHSNGGFKKIFDGKSLKGWKGDSSVWRVENNTISGEVTAENPLSANTFLIYEKELSDFELKAEFKITAEGNSGINYRSEPVAGVPNALKGYQADIDGKNVYTGQNYEERGRGFLAKRGGKASLTEGKDPSITPIADGGNLKKSIRAEDWNTIRIVAKGNTLSHFINGVLMSEVIDNDTTNGKLRGLLGLQAHVGPPMKVQYREIYLKTGK